MSWRWVFFVNVPIGLALLVVSRLALDETPRHPGRFDLVGAFTATIGTTALVYGFVRAASDGWTDLGTEVAFVTGAALLSLFVAVELRAASPITPLELFRHRTRSAALLGRVLLVAGMMGTFFYLTQFLQDVLGYAPMVTGLAFLPLTVMVFAMSRVSATLMTRTGMRVLMVGGLLISATALLLLSRLHADSGYLAVLVPLLLFGTGNGLAFVPLTAAALTDVEPAQAGAASGLVNVAQQVGGSLGLAILVTLGSSAARRSDARSAPPRRTSLGTRSSPARTGRSSPRRCSSRRRWCCSPWRSRVGPGARVPCRPTSSRSRPWPSDRPGGARRPGAYDAPG